VSERCPFGGRSGSEGTHTNAATGHAARVTVPPAYQPWNVYLCAWSAIHLQSDTAHTPADMGRCQCTSTNFICMCRAGQNRINIRFDHITYTVSAEKYGWRGLKPHFGARSRGRAKPVFSPKKLVFQISQFRWPAPHGPPLLNSTAGACSAHAGGLGGL